MPKETYDQRYAPKKFYWGTKPSNLVKNFAKLANIGHALDLGMGEGRDAIYLAQQEFRVKGVDQSQVGVDKCLRRAKQLGLKVDVVVDDVRHFRIAKNKYSLILSNSLFQYITKSEAHQVSRNVISGLKKGGLVIASVFTYDDPRYREYKKKCNELEPGTFLLVSGDIYSLYDYRELMTFFESLRLLYYTEYDYLHNRGGRGDHWHGIAEIVAKKM
jgi:cyclopropane fatty-acyl-phospholipid synthase-like methyltransferase